VIAFDYLKMSMSCLSTSSFTQDGGKKTVSMSGGLSSSRSNCRNIKFDLEANSCSAPPVMKTGSFGATIHFSRVSASGDGGGSNGGVAVKKYWIDQTAQDNGEDLVRYIRHEVSTMKMLKHENILTCLGSLVVEQEVWLITPLMEYGSVTSLLGSGFQDGLPEMICCFIIRDILLALQYLHLQGVVHRSVRCSHILVSGKGEAVLSGFRYSTSLHSTGEHRSNLYDYPLHGITSNLFWLAPEILKQNLLGYSETSDVYSLGVASCEMANGVVPYSDFPSTLMLIEKLRGSSPRLLDFSTLSAAQQETEDPVEGGDAGSQEAGGSQQVAGGRSGQPPGTRASQIMGQHGLTDSGVGESVGSCNNMLGKNSTFYNREFSPHFHDFVADCTISCGEERPGSTQLLQHPWIKQLRKTNVTLLTLLHSVKPVTAATTASAASTEELRQDEGLMVEQVQGLLIQEDNTTWDFD